MNEEPGLLGYQEFLGARDGEADLVRHRLSKREAFFEELARNPVRSSMNLDRATYLRHMARRRPEPGLHPRILWIVATAKANQAERFGVGLAELLGRVSTDNDPVRVHITLQETYHTRILAEVVAMFGLPVHAHPPRALVTSAVRGQRLASNPINLRCCHHRSASSNDSRVIAARNWGSAQLRRCDAEAPSPVSRRMLGDDLRIRQPRIGGE